VEKAKPPGNDDFFSSISGGYYVRILQKDTRERSHGLNKGKDTELFK
jgi:hypothetical protein